MRDFKLIVPEDPSKVNWNLDIDIIEGQPSLLPYARNNQDQRASLAAYMVKGTIPGMPDTGVEWDQLYNQNASILNIDNSIKQNIQQFAGTPGAATQNYIPVYTKDDKGIHVIVYQSA